MIIERLPNSVIDEIIKERYVDPLRRAMLHDRFVIGLTYEMICRKATPNWDWMSDRVKRKKIKALKVFCAEFADWAEKEYT